MKNFIHNLLLTLWYLIAIVIIVLAIFAVLAGALTPMLNKHKSVFEKLAEKLLNTPVEIGKIRAVWEGVEPDLEFDNIIVYHKDSRQKLFQLEKLQANINIIKMLWTQHLEVSRLAISGVHFTVKEDNNSHYDVYNLSNEKIFPLSSAKNNTSSFENSFLINWIAHQPSLLLQNVSVDFYPKNKAPVNVLLQGANLKNSLDDHDLFGRIFLSDPSRTQLIFGVEIKGSLNDLKTSDINIYGDLKNLNFQSDYLPYFPIQIKNYQLTQGLINGRFWGSLHGLTWQSIHTVFTLNQFNLEFLNQHQNLKIPYFSGNILWTNTENNWQLLGDDIHLNLERTDWLHLPGITNLSGKFLLNSTQGSALVDSHQALLDFGKLFETPLFTDSFTGRFYWKQLENGTWHITGHQFEAANSDLALSADLSLFIPQGARSPEINILSGLEINDTSKVQYYFPYGVFHQELSEWLKNAFISGAGASATFILHGPIDKFPFVHHEGQFIVDANVRPTTFHYAPGWPDADDLEAHLVFHNHSMSCHAFAGHVYQVKVKQFNAEIPHMGDDHPNVLLLDGHLDGDASDMMRFLKTSPLKESIGEDLAPLNLIGDTGIDLNIHIPLSDTNKTTVEGKTEFQDAILTIPAWNLTLNKLTGILHFTDKGLSSEKLFADLFDEPTYLDIQTLHDEKNISYTQIKLQSYFELNHVLNTLHLNPLPGLNGGADYLAVIDLRTAHGDNSPNHLQLLSDLYGVDIDLPEPFKKSVNTPLPFRLDLSFGSNQPTQLNLLFWKYLDSLFLFRSEKNQWQFDRGMIQLGDQRAKMPIQQKLIIQGRLSHFDLSQWEDYLDKMPKKSTQTSSMINTIKTVLNLVDVRIDELKLLGREFLNAQVQLQPNADNIRLNISNPIISGDIFIPWVMENHVIKANLERIVLTAGKTSDQLKQVNPGNIPALNINVKNLMIGDKRFSKTYLTSQPKKDAMDIQRIAFTSPFLSGNLKGLWHLTAKNKYETQLTGKLISSDLEGLLKSIQFHSGILSNNAQASIDIKWADTLLNPSLLKLTGWVHMSLGHGRIVDLGEQTTRSLNLGRIITVLSVQRLISLNFEDFLKKGYGFDSMRGDIKLNNGTFETRNLIFLGAVANLFISGTVDVVHRKLNLYIVVTPHVTSSVPIVAAVAINPLVGAATWAVSRLVGDKLDSIANKYYSVTGGFDKPIITQVKKFQTTA